MWNAVIGGALGLLPWVGVWFWCRRDDRKFRERNPHWQGWRRP